MAVTNSDLMLQTMVAAFAAGIMLIVVSRRFQLPAIVLLLLGGYACGPQILGIVRPDSLGGGLIVIVELAVGLILFDGGLTLDVQGYRLASGPIRRLLTVGVVVTWLGTAVAIGVIFPDVPISIALLAGSLVIVTGPTVIGPLLKRTKVNARLNHILHWESVLIDPIGVFVAILCFEWIGGMEGGTAVAHFGMRVFWGLVVGIGGGLLVHRLLHGAFVPEELINISVLAMAVLIFGLGEVVLSKSGLLSVTVAGFVIGVKNPPELKRIRRFKAEIADLAIGILFILLAARLRSEQFLAFGAGGALVVAIVMFVIRPLNVVVSTVGHDVSWREQLFLSWIAPRGIVAASMASLFALQLADAFADSAAFVETFVYSVIVGTVVLQGLTAGLVADLLKVRAPAPTGWMIVGAHRLGQEVARFVSETAHFRAILVDTNAKTVSEARQEGLQAIVADARDPELAERDEFQAIGNLVALTDNEDLNMLLCQRWSEAFGRSHVFFWSPSADRRPAERPGQAVWSRLPKPSILSAELARNEAAAVLDKSTAPSRLSQGTPIAAFYKNQVNLTPADSAPAGVTEPYPLLVLRREADYLRRGLRPELAVRLEVADQRALFEELVSRIVEVEPKVPREAMLKELIDREQVWPTALGHGIAVPHAYCRALTGRICAVAQIPEGVDFKSPDGEKVRLVFLLLSPQGDPEGHLATMAEIARMVADPEVRNSLLSASSPEDLLARLRTAAPA